MNDLSSVAAAAANDDTKTTTVATKPGTKKKPRTDAKPTTTATRHGPDSTTKAAAVRRGTKTAKILAMLQRPDGASVKELKRATGWQAHSVRGFLSGVIKKKLGFRVASSKRSDGERAYRLRSK